MKLKQLFNSPLLLILLAIVLFSLFCLFYHYKFNNLLNNKEGFSQKDTKFPGGDITHYWDCCKESCAWSDSPAQVNSCDINGLNPAIRDDTQKSVCKPDNQNITTCAGNSDASRYPWIEGDTLYGFVAGPNNGKAPCGSCYEIELSNAENGVKKAIVQQTSLGNVNGIFDFAVPGGGFGDFNGCSNMKGWNVYTDQGGPCDPNSDTDSCTRYGGFHNADLCQSAFSGDSNAQEACKDILFGVFPKNASGVPYQGNLKASSYKSITCPKKLTDRSNASAQPFVPPPPSEICNSDCGDCSWAQGNCNDTSKCGVDKCYTTCCNKLNLDCQDFCSGSGPTQTKYSCNSKTNQCKEDPNGAYSSLSDCQNNCSSKPPSGGGFCTWNPTNGCAAGPGQGGAYCDESENNCLGDCKGIKWCPSSSVPGNLGPGGENDLQLGPGGQYNPSLGPGGQYNPGNKHSHHSHHHSHHHDHDHGDNNNWSKIGNKIGHIIGDHLNDPTKHHKHHKHNKHHKHHNSNENNKNILNQLGSDLKNDWNNILSGNGEY